MTQKFKGLIKASLYYLIGSIVRPSKLIVADTLLLIRTDAIGDYVLFRNFLEILRTSEKYKDHHITLLGNIAWKELAVEFDDQFIDTFIWIDIRKFERNPFYRYSKLSTLTGVGYETLINTIFSRDFYISDSIAKLVSAKKKIASIGNMSNISPLHKQISDQFYTDLLPVDKSSMFEFYRNREFFECLLGKNLEIQKPTLTLTSKHLSIELPDNFAVLFIGASCDARKWSISNFAKVAKHLKQVYGQEIVLCGSSVDRAMANKFSDYFLDEYLDLVGKTSMVELLCVIDQANVMVSNETVAPHLAVALGKKNILVVYNGIHYGRFTPYPKAMTDHCHVIYHPKIAKSLFEYAKISNTYGYVNEFDINDIKVNEVISKIKTI